MKKTHIAAAVSLAALIAGGAIAQSASQSAQTPAPRHARGDADQDGRVSRAEFVQARVTRLAALDTNTDGTVTAEEAGAALQARRAQHAALRFDRLDADKDGSISRVEFDAPREGRAAEGRADRPDHAGRGPGRHGGAHRMGRGPEGRHGAERMARGPVVIAEAQTKATAAFTRLDADHDGYLTREERRAGMREHRQERRAERTARREQRQASPSAPASE